MAWTAVTELQRTWRLLRDEFLAVPRPHRAAFAWTLTFGWAIAAAVSFGMAWLARRPLAGWLAARERAWIEQLVDAAPFDHSTAIFLESPGNGVVVFPLAITLAIVFVRRRKPLLGLGVLAAALMSGLVVLATWLLWPRERPTFLYPDLPASGLSAFPSGHLATGIPLYGLLAWLWWRRATGATERAAAVIVTVAGLATTACARLVLSAHWPSDLLAGALLGGFWLGVVLAALRRGRRVPA